MSIDREKLISEIFRSQMQSLQYPTALGSGLSLARRLAPRMRKVKGGGKEEDAIEDYKRWLAKGSAKSAPAAASESDEDEDSVADAVGGSAASATFARLLMLGKLNPKKMKKKDHFSAETLALAKKQHRKAVRHAKAIAAMPTKEERAEARKEDRERLAEQIARARAAKRAAEDEDDTESESDAEGGAVTALHKAAKKQAGAAEISYKEALKMLLGLKDNDERAKHGLKAKRAKAKPGDKRLKRGEDVAKIMKAVPCDLPTASQILKTMKERGVDMAKAVAIVFGSTV
jgi:hypothetical protein